MINVLAIGDSHVSANDNDLERFSTVSQHIRKTKPEVIVLMGDFLTLDCVSAWDKNKRLRMEGRRYAADIAAGNRGLNILFNDMDALQKKQAKNKKKQYNPSIYYLQGNHEERLDRYLEVDPTFQGHVSVENDLNLKARGITWVPYRTYLDVDGVGFTHIPHSAMGPIGSSGLQVSVCKKALQYVDGDVVFGHTHKLEVGHRTLTRGRQSMAINVGNMLSKQGEEYMQGKLSDWWSGVVDITIDNNHIAGHKAISRELLEKLYGYGG